MTTAFTRREFFRAGLGQAARSASAVARASLERVVPSTHVRPPGALGEPELVTTCTRCNDCVAACPHTALSLLPASAGAAAGTPVVRPRVQACLMCADAPCIAACAPRALRSGPEEPVPAIGRAEVAARHCWSALGQDCDYCERECRRHVSAIRLRRGAAPVVDPTRCDGCGRCEYICPVPGEAAIRVVPAGART